MKSFSLQAKVYIIFSLVSCLVIITGWLGIRTMGWMKQENSLLVTFNHELNKALESREKLVLLHSKFIDTVLANKEKIETIESEISQLDEKTRSLIRILFYQSRGCLECHSPKEIIRLGKDMEKNFAYFIKVGSEIISKKKELIKLLEEKKGKVDKGYIKEIITSAKAIEDEISDFPTLMADFLQIRKHEKNYLLWFDDQYKNSFRESILKFKNNLSKINLPLTKIQKINKFLETYINAFNQTSLVQTQIYQLQSEIETTLTNRLTGIYNELYVFIDHGVEESNKFVLQANERVSNVYTKARRFLIVTMGLTILAAIVGLLFSYANLVSPLRKIANNIQQIVESVLSVAKNQNENIARQTSAVAQVSTSTEELSRTAEAVAKQSEVIVHVANKALQVSEEVKTRNQAAIGFINEIKAQTDKAAEKIVTLGEKIDEIGKVLDLIDEVASQTKLLAFNAAIEAVSAGEAGKRFSIVAKHIKDLADNTSSSAEEIRKLMEEIKSLTHATVISTEQMQNAVNKGVDQVTTAREAIVKIKEIIQENHEVAQKINIATTQQKSSTEQISTAMEELYRLAQEVNEGSKHTVEAMHRLYEEISFLKKMIEGQEGE